jgi:hypothetical protein
MTNTSIKRPKYFYMPPEESESHVEMLYAAYEHEEPFCFYLTANGWQTSSLGITYLRGSERHHPVSIFQIRNVKHFTPHKSNATV